MFKLVTVISFKRVGRALDRSSSLARLGLVRCLVEFNFSIVGEFFSRVCNVLVIYEPSLLFWKRRAFQGLVKLTSQTRVKTCVYLHLANYMVVYNIHLIVR